MKTPEKPAAENARDKPARSRLWHVIAALLLSVLTLYGSKWAPNLLPYDSSISDYFRVTRANSVASQRTTPPDVTLVMVGEHFINQLPYRSPVDRCVLAAGIASIMSLDPKVIGVDFLLDKTTEPHKDDMLRKIILDNQENLVLAVNATNDANIDMPDADKTEDSFSPEAMQASARLIKDPDYVVRKALLYDEDVPAFAARLVQLYGKSAGNPDTGNEFQIDWLANDSGRDDAFTILPLELFLNKSINDECAVNLDLPEADTRAFLRPQIENKIVIIGASLEREDRHITPLDAVWHEKIALSGAEIHANIAQQLIDGRSIHNVSQYISLLILFLAFLFSLAISAITEKRDWPHYMVLLGPVALAFILSGINWMFIYQYGVVLPTGLAAFAIGANILLELFKDMVCKSCDQVVLTGRKLLKL